MRASQVVLDILDCTAVGQVAGVDQEIPVRYIGNNVIVSVGKTHYTDWV